MQAAAWASKAVQRLRQRIDGGRLPALQHVGVTRVAVPVPLGEDQELDVNGELFRPQPALDVHHVLKHVAGVAVAAAPGTHQHGTLHELRMAQGKLLRDDAAHRAADHADLADPQGGQQPGVVVGHLALV